MKITKHDWREFKAWLWLKTIGRIHWYIIVIPRRKRIKKLEENYLTNELNTEKK